MRSIYQNELCIRDTIKLGTTWFQFFIAVSQIPKYVELSLWIVGIPRWCLIYSGLWSDLKIKIWCSYHDSMVISLCAIEDTDEKVGVLS